VEGIPSQGVAAEHIIAMKFSTEAIVAAVVAVVFVLLSFGAIAREQGEPARVRHSAHNAYIAASNANPSRVAASDTDVLGAY
jgi:hypothetical protein